MQNATGEPLPTAAWQRILSFLGDCEKFGTVTIAAAADDPKKVRPPHPTPPLAAKERLEVVKTAVAALKRAGRARALDADAANEDLEEKRGALSRASVAYSNNELAAGHATTKQLKNEKLEAQKAFDKAKSHQEKTHDMNEGVKRAILRQDELLRKLKKKQKKKRRRPK